MRRVGAYEAKTHLPRLLTAVEAGETIAITRRGATIALLSPVGDPERTAVAGAIERLRTFRRRHPLDGTTIRELIDEGRR